MGGKKMNKKKYFIIGITILFFLIVILIILFSNNKKVNWIEDIITSDNYTITMTDCNSRQIILPQETLKNLSSKLKNISDNGPWTGDDTKCYSKISIAFEKNNIIQTREILLTSDDTLVVNLNDGYRYYTNTKEANSYIKSLFNTY